MEEKDYCSICGSFKKMRIPEIGISFGMTGKTYCFCYNCLKTLTADKFFRIIANKEHLAYPLKFVTDERI